MRLIKNLLGQRKILFEILSIFIVSRLLIVVIAYLSNLIIIKDWWFSKFPKPDSLLNLFFKWDSQWYMSIVEKGYFYIPGKESSVGFFPLYPMLVKVFSMIFRNPKLTGFIISNIALLSAAIYFYKLVIFDFEDTKVASKTVFYMLISPLSFFFSIFYTEGLFLFLTISAFYYARKKQWLIASILGFFVSLTRAPGIFIIVPLLIEYFAVDFKSFKIDFKKIKKDILYLLLIPAGLFTFMFYSYVKFNDALAYFHAQYFHAQRAPVQRGFVFVFATLKSALYYPLFFNIIFIGSVILALILILYLIYAKVRISYIVYSSLLLFLYLSLGALEGIPRYISVLFPIYLGMALLANRSKFLEYFFSLSSIMLLTLFTILFVNGYWFN